jgi:hypothetical protein
VTWIEDDLYEVQPVVDGVPLAGGVLPFDALPGHISSAILILEARGVDNGAPELGVMIAEGMWELCDSCLKPMG